MKDDVLSRKLYLLLFLLEIGKSKRQSGPLSVVSKEIMNLVTPFIYDEYLWGI